MYIGLLRSHLIAHFGTVLQGLSDVDLACMKAAVADHPEYVNSINESTGSQDDSENPLRHSFDDENIFTEGSVGFKEDGEKVLRLKFQILQLMANLFPKSEIEESSILVLGTGSFNIVIAVTLQPMVPR